MNPIFKRTSLILFILFSLISSVKADHIVGSDISYVCTDTAGVYDIIFNFYRDCNGCYVLGQTPHCGTSENCSSSATAPTSLKVTCISGSSTSNLGNISLTRTGIVDITPTCSGEPSRCDQPCNGTFPFGIEKHTFEGSVDLRSAITAGCCDFEISVQLSVRSADITTGQQQQTFYTSCEINSCKAPCNSSPVLTNDPVAILCCNQSYSFNNGAIDTAERDSISYSFAKAYRGQNLECSYNSVRTYLNPISTFYPGTLQFPYCNPNANPPIGLCLDNLTGDIIFTPTNCSEVAVVVIQMVEWRKDTFGVYQKIGTTRRDMQFIVMSCPDNNPPIVNGPYSYNVCEGSNICFNVTTNDIQFIPPGGTTALPDTVTTSWNKGIPGATFTIINPTQRLQTGQFCWTPGAGTASDLPYSFTVTAKDNACPLNAVSVRSFRVRVKPRAEAGRIIDTLPCGVYALESDPIDGFKGNPSYQWTILDSNRNIIFDKKIAKFNSTGNFLSTKQFDTLLFRQGGMYIVQHDINNIPINCPTTYYDTIIVPPLLEANLTLGQDTFVCAGTDLVFEPYLSNTTPPVVYQWSTMGVTDDGDFLNNVTSNASDTKDTFLLSVQNVVYDTAVSIFITDASGCTSEDTVQVFLKANPLAVLPPDPRICSYDSIQIIPNLDTAYWVDPIAGDTLLQGDTLYKEWYFNGSSIPFSYEDSVTINMRGEYVIRVYDSLQCADTDTLFLWVNDTVTANAGPDQTLCAKDLYIISGNGLDSMVSGVSGFYRWSNITSSGATSILGFDKTYELTADMDSTYRLELTVTQQGVTCFDDDTTEMFVNALPIVTLGPDQDVCCDYGDISLSFSIVAPTGNPSTGGWTCTSNPSLISSNVFNTSDACDLIAAPAKKIDVNAVYTFMEPSTLCVQTDSILITVNSLPNLILQEQNYCQDIGSIRLDDDVVISPANTSLGSPSWICLDSNNNNFIGNILENRGSQFAPDYWLNIDETRYTIQNPDKDTLILEFRYTNEKGCKAVDTTSVIIWRVPKIVFNSNRDLCFDEGEIELDTLTSINISGGTWSCYDSLGFESCAGNSLGGIVGDTINTLNSLNDNAAHTWMLRYYHIATGCPAENFIPITINPLPQPSIDPFVGNRTAFCETESDQPLTASPAGGIWSCDDPTALVGSAFSPGSGTVQAQDLSIYYNYTNPVTGCKNVDSTIGRIDPSPSLNTPNDTVFCRQMSQTTVDINYNITGTNHNGISWFTNNAFGNQNRMSVSTHSDIADEILTLNLQNYSSDTFRIITAAAGLAACNAIDDFFDVIVNPIPDVRLTNSNPNGCNPVSSDFDVQFNNTVDPATSLYDWNLGEGSTSTASAASATYNQDGQSIISVVVTSDKGCDTTINSTVDVYPIPVASFVPNPNNFTTAALPRFFFNNESVVDDILGSRIVLNEWDFGDWNSIIDTSTLENPPYVYPPDTGTYSVLLRVTTNFGCTDTFSYTVEIGPDLIVYVPNAFVPDGAGPEKNEGFHAIISGEKQMELIIFNRWGEIMFESIKKEEQWDGTYKGLPAQQDVYAYALKVTALNDEVYTYTGTVTLIR